MNNNDPLENRPAMIELEESLRSLVPRAPKFDVASIERGSAPADHIAAPAKISWMVLGGACGASALTAAVFVFALMQVQIVDLRNQLTAVMNQNEQPLDSLDPITVAQDSDNVTTSNVVGGATFDALPHDMQAILRGGSESRLAVGSHLRRVTYQFSPDRVSASNEPSKGFPAAVPHGERRPPATRASLREDLLDT